MGTSKQLFRLIINTLTFYSIFVCSRNSILFTSTHEPILPTFCELLLPVRKMKCRKVVLLQEHSLYRSLIIWIFSLFISVLNRGEPGTRSPRQHSAAQQWNCPSLSCSSLGYLWHTSNFYNKWDSDLADNSLLLCKPWFILQAGPGGKKRS